MSHYIDLRGHQVWSSEWTDNGENLLLLHGGLSATEDFDFYMLPAVEDSHHVFAYDRSAQGRTGDRPGSLHFDFQTDEAIQYLEDVVKGPAHLIGYSDGGIISLMVALKRPDLVKSIVAIGTNYHFNFGGEPLEPWEVGEEELMEHKLRSPDDPKHLDSRNKRMVDIWNSEPTLTLDDLGIITCPTLILSGDDELFSFDHTTSMYEALPQGQLAIIPGASHHSFKDKPELAQMIIRSFLSDLNPPITRLPYRRLKSEPI